MIIINICGHSIIGNLKYDIHYLKKELKQEIVKFILYKLYVIKIFHITNYVFVLQLRINTLFKAHFT